MWALNSAEDYQLLGRLYSNQNQIVFTIFRLIWNQTELYTWSLRLISVCGEIKRNFLLRNERHSGRLGAENSVI